MSVQVSLHPVKELIPGIQYHDPYCSPYVIDDNLTATSDPSFTLYAINVIEVALGNDTDLRIPINKRCIDDIKRVLSYDAWLADDEWWGWMTENENVQSRHDIVPKLPKEYQYNVATRDKVVAWLRRNVGCYVVRYVDEVECSQ